jgi:hypothetical protein
MEKTKRGKKKSLGLYPIETSQTAVQAEFEYISSNKNPRKCHCWPTIYF